MRAMVSAMTLAMVLATAPAVGQTGGGQPQVQDPEPEHVTIKNRLMCRSQRSLREALRAIDYKDQDALNALQDCFYSIEDVPALVLQDSVSMIKIRLFGASGRIVEYWTLPGSVRRADKR